jgi:hypothetical protein
VGNGNLGRRCLSNFHTRQDTTTIFGIRCIAPRMKSFRSWPRSNTSIARGDHTSSFRGLGECPCVPAPSTESFARGTKDRALSTEYDARCSRDLGGVVGVRAEFGRRKMEIEPSAGARFRVLRAKKLRIGWRCLHAGDLAVKRRSLPTGGIEPNPSLTIFGSTGRCALEAAVC